MTLRGSTGDRRLNAVVRLLVLTTCVSAALVSARVLYTESSQAANLVWNLVLAWIPLLLAVLVYGGYRRSVSRPALLAGAALWLLFLPNAPYIVTDFKLLPDWTGVPTWFDVLLLTLAAGTGLALGFVSLYVMHALVRWLVPPVEGWLLVVLLIALSSFGVYVGRVQRWNSWDVVAKPLSLLQQTGERLSDPLAHGRALAAIALYTGFLTLGYAAFYRVARLGQSNDGD
jgi:uncharacterized membrane protein